MTLARLRACPLGEVVVSGHSLGQSSATSPKEHTRRVLWVGRFL